MARSLSRWRLLAVLSVVLGVAIAGCAQGGGIAAGTALNDAPGSSSMGVRAMPPGANIGILNLAIYNRSNSPLTITNVTITGRGLGTIARVTEIKIAAVGYDPGGLYVTDPPVYHFLPGNRFGPAGCSVQVLRSPRGYVLPPGTGHGLRNIYIWAVVQMVHPGRYSSLGSTVYYTQGGSRYHDFVMLGFNGSVASTAAWPAVVNEKGCLDKTHLLNPGHG
jgi:hypothetical protein